MLSFANNPSVSNLLRFNEITDSWLVGKPDCNELLRKRNECYLVVAATVDSLNTIQAHVLKSWNF
jgi:hypothetical protein